MYDFIVTDRLEDFLYSLRGALYQMALPYHLWNEDVEEGPSELSELVQVWDSFKHGGPEGGEHVAWYRVD